MFVLEDVSVSVIARPVLSSTLSGVSSLIISNSLSQLSSSATSAHPTSHHHHQQPQHFSSGQLNTPPTEHIIKSLSDAKTKSFQRAAEVSEFLQCICSALLYWDRVLILLNIYFCFPHQTPHTHRPSQSIRQRWRPPLSCFLHLPLNYLQQFCQPWCRSPECLLFTFTSTLLTTLNLTLSNISKLITSCPYITCNLTRLHHSGLT